MPVVVLLAGCGGGGGTTAQTTTAPPPVTTTAPPVLAAGTDCAVDDVVVKAPFPRSGPSTRASGAIAYTASYELWCRKPPPGAPLKGLDSNIQIGITGQSPTNTSMPAADSAGHTDKTVDPLPKRYEGADVYVSVYGSDKQWHVVGTTYVPTT